MYRITTMVLSQHGMPSNPLSFEMYDRKQRGQRETNTPSANYFFQLLVVIFIIEEEPEIGKQYCNYRFQNQHYKYTTMN